MPDLVRAILLEIEKAGKPDELITSKELAHKLEGYNEDDIYYHIRLMDQAGLINATSMGGNNFLVNSSLPWEGHEFLDLARNKTIWSTAKNTLAERGMDVSFAIITELLAKLTKNLLFGA